MKYIYLVITLLSSLFSFSQSDSLDYYFDDNAISEVNTIIKINPIPAIGGELLLHVERSIVSHLSLEVGLGKQIPNRYQHRNMFLNLILEDDLTLNASSIKGHSIWIMPKWYYSSDADFQRGSASILFRQQNLKIESYSNPGGINPQTVTLRKYDIRKREYMYAGCYQVNPRGRLSLEYMCAFGLGIIDTFYENGTHMSSTKYLAYLVNIKLGIIL